MLQSASTAGLHIGHMSRECDDSWLMGKGMISSPRLPPYRLPPILLHRA